MQLLRTFRPLTCVMPTLANAFVKHACFLAGSTLEGSTYSGEGGGEDDSDQGKKPQQKNEEFFLNKQLI